jgi:hypothetical protein
MSSQLKKQLRVAGVLIGMAAALHLVGGARARQAHALAAVIAIVSAFA